MGFYRRDTYKIIILKNTILSNQHHDDHFCKETQYAYHYLGSQWRPVFIKGAKNYNCWEGILFAWSKQSGLCNCPAYIAILEYISGNLTEQDVYANLKVVGNHQYPKRKKIVCQFKIPIKAHRNIWSFDKDLQIPHQTLWKLLRKRLKRNPSKLQLL